MTAATRLLSWSLVVLFLTCSPGVAPCPSVTLAKLATAAKCRMRLDNLPTSGGSCMNSRHALLSHCLANQNAKVDEYAICAGCVQPVLNLLRQFGYRLHQMPCPEMGFLGVSRWWQV